MSTVTISIKDILGAGFSAAVKFTAYNTPFTENASLIVGQSRTVVTDITGSASTILEPGQYGVTIKGYLDDEIIIGVPDDNATYTLTSLIIAGTTTPPAFVPGALDATPRIYIDQQTGETFQVEITNGEMIPVKIPFPTGTFGIDTGLVAASDIRKDTITGKLYVISIVNGQLLPVPIQ